MYVQVLAISYGEDHEVELSAHHTYLLAHNAAAQYAVGHWDASLLGPIPVGADAIIDLYYTSMSDDYTIEELWVEGR